MQAALQAIGNQLDRNIFPMVKNGGIVVPNDSTRYLSTTGTEMKNARSRKRRSKTRSRSGASGWQGSSRRSWPSSKAAQVIVTDVKAKYEAELDLVRDAYPGTKIWSQPDGIWLITESSLLPKDGHKAKFLVGIYFGTTVLVRGWGFWDGFSWIGPRHTNFPDGSICAFEPTDGTWVISDPIIDLLDLYTLWAVRHLHLKVLGRWPGHQAVFHPYERILELKDDELCGCGKSDILYGKCCKNSDLSRNMVAIAVNYTLSFAGGLRQPPDAVIKFIRGERCPPDVKNVLADPINTSAFSQ